METSWLGTVPLPGRFPPGGQGWEGFIQISGPIGLVNLSYIHGTNPLPVHSPAPQVLSLTKKKKKTQ